MTNIKMKTALLTALIATASLLSALAALAQTETPSAGQVRRTLQAAIEHYQRGEFEKADDFFRAAQAGQQGLTPAEQKDLGTFAGRNTDALKSRGEGAQQLHQAEEAIQKGRPAEAIPLLNALNSNQYLSPTDRQQLGELNRRMQAQAGGVENSALAKVDAKTMLVNGRKALEAGDLNTAETWAKQAEKASSMMPAWLRPWEDNPAKLNRDIQALRNRQQLLAKSQEPAVKGQEPVVKGPETVEKKDPPKKEESRFAALWPFGGAAKEKEPAKEPAKSSEDKVEAMIARQVVKDGFVFLKAGDMEKARFLATKAKEMNVSWSTNEPTPDLLLHEIQRAGGGAPVDPNPAAKVDPAPPKPLENAKKTEPTPKSGDPRVLLRQGRTLLQEKKLEEADKICTQVINAKASWGLFEDNPEKLRRDLQSARKIADRDQSVKLLVDARKLLAQGKFEEAEKTAYKAQHLHGPYGVFDFGDRADKLLEEINRAKVARGRDNPTPKELPKDGVAAKDQVAPKDNVIAKKEPAADAARLASDVPAGIQIANKNRAIVMIRQARELERQGMLVEARMKAKEAQGLRAPFQQEEDSPEHLMTSLAAACDRQMAAHLKQAVDTFGINADPQRFEKSQGHLQSARRLAQAFEMDQTRIAQTEMHLQQVAAGSRPFNTVAAQLPQGQDPFKVMPAVDVPSGDPKKDQLRKIGRDKLADAQREMAAGRYAQARKMAEELFNPAYGIQEDVLKFVRSINAEETNQLILDAMRNFEVGVDAVAKQDYVRAMRIFQQIDPMMLPEKHQGRLREFMSLRQMQPQEIAKQEKTFVKGGKIEPKHDYDGPVDPKNDLLDKVRAEETVFVQAMRTRGVEALRKAHELWKQDKADAREQAVDTLKGYLEQVKLASLDQAKTKDLSRAVETRIQQYQAMQAEAKLNRAEEGLRFYTKHDESGRTREITKKQQEVASMMKNASELYRQNKLKECLAETQKILEVDRDNGPAQALKFQATVKVNQEKYDYDTRRDENSHLALLGGGMGKMVDETKGVDFDPERVNRRKYGDGSMPHELKDHKERAIQYRLRQPISLNMKDVPLRQAIKDIAITSGIQMVPDDAALDKARVNMDAPLSISVDDIDMRFALNILLNKLNLTYIIEDQVLKITTPDRTSGRLVRVTYPIADLIVPVEDHPLPDILNLQKALERAANMTGMPFLGGPNYLTPPPFMYGPGQTVSSHDASGLGSAFGGQNHGGMPAPVSKEKTKDQMAVIFRDLIMNTIAKDKWEEMGGNGSIQYFPMGLALVINQPQEIQEEIQLLLATLRKLQDLQVSVELRAVLVSETFFERIGLDFDMNIRTPTSRTESTLVTGNFVPAPFVNRIGSGLKMVSGLTSAGTLTPDLNVPIRNSTFNFTTPQFGGYQPEAGLSLGLAFLSDIQVFMFLEAVQGDRRAHIMQAPKITVFNGQQAFISGTMNRPSVQGTTPLLLGNGQLVMQPITTSMPFGLGMQVQPVVSPDRRFIRLNVTPILGAGIQDPTAAIIQVNPSPAVGVLDGGAQSPPFANNPLITQVIQPSQANLTILNTTVNVPDGGTVLLGGFKFLAEERTEYGPPILSKIPYLSRLFRNVGWSRDGSTLIYLVTARVVMIEEEERIFLGELPAIPGR